MTDQELLQAMKAMLTENHQELRQDFTTMLADTKQELRQDFTTMLTETKQELRQDIMHDVTILMDAEFKSKFDLLAEGQQAILERLPDPEEMEIIEHRLSVLELSVKKINNEIKQMKAANE